MRDNLTYGEWEADDRTTSALRQVGHGGFALLPSVPGHVRRRQQIASSYRASLRSSKTRALPQLWQFLRTTFCAARLWYARRYEQGQMMASPC
jgi:hypothetical protein